MAVKNYNKTIDIHRKQHTQKHHNKYSKTFIISECYNSKHTALLTSQLRNHLKSYKLNEYTKLLTLNTKQFKLNLHNLSKGKNCSKQLNLTKKTKFPPHIKNQNFEFIWISPIEQLADRRIDGLRANLINVINQDCIKLIDNKGKIYQYMHTYCPELANKHLARTFYINETENYNFKTINHEPQYYILRPVDSFAGRDIFYISSKQELTSAIKYYNSHKNYKGVTYGNNVIASEYIINPVLLKGLKFHLRMYYLISYVDNIFNSFLLDNGDILTAAQPYTTTNPFTTNVHDTHQTSSSNDYFFPKDLKNIPNSTPNSTGLDTDDILEQMRSIMTCVSKSIINQKCTYLYPEHKNGFYIMGADFMIDARTNTVILLEVNKNPGYGYNKRNNDIEFSKQFFNWINETVLQPYYTKKPQLAQQHKTYLTI